MNSDMMLFAVVAFCAGFLCSLPGTTQTPKILVPETSITAADIPTCDCGRCGQCHMQACKELRGMNNA